MKFLRILQVMAFGCLFLTAVLSGCDRAESPPPEPKVVRKKIAPPPENLARKPSNETPAAEDAVADADGPPESGRPSSEPAPTLARADAEPSVEPERTGAGDRPAELETPSAAVPESDAASADDRKEGRGAVSPPSGAKASKPSVRDGEAEDIASAEPEPTEADESGRADGQQPEPSESIAPPADTDAETAGPLVAYSPGDRVDPFEPLFREEPEAPPAATTEKKDEPEKPARRLTPLERLDLSQLKLVGIIRAPSGDRALVEEASGKGYIITRGTYIGIHSGQVVEIQENAVVVEEKHEDVFGDVNIRRRELKFQRPAGDEIL